MRLCHFCGHRLEDLQAITRYVAYGKSVSPDAIKRTGRALHDAIFTPTIATTFSRAQEKAKKSDGLRIRLEVEPPELACLPWEAMFDGNEFLVTRSSFPLVRSFPKEQLPSSPKKLPIKGPLRILFVGASPQDQPALNIGDYANDLRSLLGEAIQKKMIIFDVLLHATPDDLRRELDKRYNILYFAGHGDDNGIILDDGQGKIDPDCGKRPPGESYPFSVGELTRALEGKDTRLVFLGSCGGGDNDCNRDQFPSTLQKNLSKIQVSLRL